MALALAEAALAPEHGDVPVGAVVLDADGQVIGRGHNARERDGDPTAHAEVLAIRQAAAVRSKALGRAEWRLEGCTLVVSLEPCAMCAGAIVASRLSRLVFGAFDDKAGAVSSLWDLVRDPRLNHRVEVVAGIGADAAATQLRTFFAQHR